jgi:hypothetical protein
MVDLHETSNPDPNGRIDTIGWLFAAFVVVITAIAVIIAYNATDIMVTNSVSHVVRSPG